MHHRVLEEFEPCLKGKYPVYTVESPHQLTQIAGFYRYTQDGGQVFFRGTSGFHEESRPSLYRISDDLPLIYSLETRQIALLKYLSKIAGESCMCPAHTRNSPKLHFSNSHRCSGISRGRRDGSRLISGTYRAVIEPLLQHYGVRTRWLDVVDNIWVALWFAVNRYVGNSDKPDPNDGSARTYAYYLRRSIAEVPENGTRDDCSQFSRASYDTFAYIYLHETGKLTATAIPGYSISDSCRVVDLRYSVPSLYLRPHAQHGVLIARRSQPDPKSNPVPADYSLTSTTAAAIRVRLVDALDWLGSGILANHHSLFPPAAVDVGYRHLLHAPMPPSPLGSITIYQGGI